MQLQFHIHNLGQDIHRLFHVLAQFSSPQVKRNQIIMNYHESECVGCVKSCRAT